MTRWARQFNFPSPGPDEINFTIPAVDTGDWTMGAWLDPRVPRPSVESIIQTSDGTFTSGQSLYLFGSKLGAQQSSASGSSASSIATEVFVEGINATDFVLAIATYTDADRTVRLYAGGCGRRMAEMAYESQIVGTGVRATGCTLGRIANQRSTPQTDIYYNGRISRLFFSRRAWSIGDMERHRAFLDPIQDGYLLAYWRLEEEDRSIAPDYSGNAHHGVVTGTEAVGGPECREARFRFKQRDDEFRSGGLARNHPTSRQRSMRQGPRNVYR